MSSAPDLTSRILRHERAIVLGGVALLAIVGWWYIVAGGGMSAGMDAMQEPPLGALILMWWLMMVAMMLPSTAPTVLLYAHVRQIRGNDEAIAQTWVFLAGYLAVWLLFSIIAAAAQRFITDSTMALNDRFAEGAVLIAAGIYQLSALKKACLRRCRSPAQYISLHWRPGWSGAVRLGILHGADCVGCCWMLMALLFVGGVMNLWWIVALTAIVAVEKLLPREEWFGRATGSVLFAWGLVKIAGF